jgi:hypothetical protein
VEQLWLILYLKRRTFSSFVEASGNLLVKALRHKSEGHGFDTRLGDFFLSSIYIILPTALGPGVYSASKRNQNQKHKNLYLGSKARPVRKADNITAICESTV